MTMVVPARCSLLQNWSQLHPTSSKCWLLQDLALGCQDYITTVVYQHDVIPRASLAGFEALRQEMLATQWEENLTADVSSLLHLPGGIARDEQWLVIQPNKAATGTVRQSILKFVPIAGHVPYLAAFGRCNVALPLALTI